MAKLCKKGIANMVNASQVTCGQYFLIENCENLRVNNLKWLTINQHKRPIIEYKIQGFKSVFPIPNGFCKTIMGKDATTNPFAGIGTPVK